MYLYIKNIVPLYMYIHVRPITANESRHAHALDEVWGVANEVK